MNVKVGILFLLLTTIFTYFQYNNKCERKENEFAFSLKENFHNIRFPHSLLNNFTITSQFRFNSIQTSNCAVVFVLSSLSRSLNHLTSIDFQHFTFV